MEKPKPSNPLELITIHKDTVSRLEELRDRFDKIDQDVAEIVNGILEDFLVGGVTSTEALRRANLVRDSIDFGKK